MIDREKVIKGLEICTSMQYRCTDCPYYANCCLDGQEVMENALALLKEQEALEKRLDDSDRINVVRCSECQYWQPPTYAEQEDGSTVGHCTAALNGQQTDAYWFCADGVR